MASIGTVPVLSGGVCCPCGQQVGCSCSGGTSCALECQSKSATAALEGIAEFTSPSTPPRLFLAESCSGNVDGCEQQPGCGGPPSGPGGFGLSYSGSYTIDALTLGVTNSQSEKFFGSDATNGCGVGAQLTDNAIGVPFTPPFSNYPNGSVDTPLTKKYTFNSCNFANQKFQGEIDVELSQEDTEENAIARANVPLDFMSTDCQAFPAFITQRTGTDTTFAYRHVQSRVHLIAPTNHHTYDITTFYYRRIAGSSDPWIFFSLNTQSKTVITEAPQSDDLAAIYTPYTDVPNEAGFETRAQACTVLDVTL